MIEIIGTELYQWDTDRSVKVTGDATHVHFANQGDSKAAIVEIDDGHEAKIPDHLLQTGKQLCVYAFVNTDVDDVKNGFTIERKTFSVKKRERPEDYVYDKDQRDFIYALITDAQRATENANLATKNANDAADKALQAANSWVMVGEVSGESIAVSDAANHTLMGLRIFGKTTQDGTPTPDAPVDLVSVGDSGSITVDVANGEDEPQSMTIATPNGLPGIPVTDGGNYTDANGQQWVCDEIDFARGVYVQRIQEASQFSPDTTYNLNRLYQQICSNEMIGQYAPVSALCTHTNTYRYAVEDTTHLYIDGTVVRVYLPIGTDVTGLKVYAILKNPIPKHLSAEELAAYAALHTYKENTMVSNDASAHMELEYVMDAKKYIDSLMTGTIIQASVE